MEGYVPLNDALVILGFMAILATVCFIGDKYDKRKKAALRGATRIA